ncbi:MAG: CheR family methyltransferase [Treponema sp.]|nr:chemotaxis protein CheW [Spirochaetia bacterium]MDY2839560.1 CheR family methyltransferase [Treponema sp.]
MDDLASTLGIPAVGVAEQQREEKENSVVIDFKMVTFSLAGKDYSIDIMHVKEIAKAGRFTFVPNTLPFVLGVYNLRGEIIPILDLRLFFNIDVPERKDDQLENLLILQVEDQKFGVVVDKIDKVVGVQKSTIQPPHPLFGDINIKYIDGVVEANKRLYVLLDITRIFTSKDSLEVEDKRPVYKTTVNRPVEVSAARSTAASAPVKAQVTSKPVENEDAKIQEALKFVKESLLNYKKFYVTPVNESWVKHRYLEWSKQKGDPKAQIQNEADAEDFLKTFWSTCNDTWWTEDFANKISNLLPQNSAKQINVWNPGCGKGTESYSLACILAKKYPGVKFRIYAQDTDLLGVSNATLMTVPEKVASTWYGPYLTKKANGEYTFNQEIKDSIMFEYHDCKNTNALPMVDIVFARDILSLLDEKSVESVISDFQEKMKGNAVAILGDNESMPSSFKFGENSVDALVAYTKD